MKKVQREVNLEFLGVKINTSRQIMIGGLLFEVTTPTEMEKLAMAARAAVEQMAIVGCPASRSTAFGRADVG